MKKPSWILLLIGLAFFMVGCGSSSGTSDSSSSGISTVADLPASTGEVSDGSSSSSSLVKYLGSSEVGMPLGSITSSDFSSQNSLAACEMFNMTKTAINEAGMGDLIQCYVTTTFDTFADTNGIDIYDGNYHVFALDFSGSSFEEEQGGESAGPDLVKFKITRDGNNAITGFEMFACTSGSQEMYINQTISGNDFSMTVVNQGGFGDMTFSDAATVSGTLNSSGNFVDEVDGVATPKVIHMQHKGASPSQGFDFWGDLTFTQYADSATLTGTMSGSNTYQSTTCTFTSDVSGSVDLIDGNTSGTDNYQIGLLEVGDGAVKGEDSGSCGSDTWSNSFTDAWSGATALSLSDPTESSHYSTVDSVTLSTATEPSVSFGDNTYDCGDSPEATVVFANLGVDVSNSCSKYELGHEHIDCWHIMGDEN